MKKIYFVLFTTVFAFIIFYKVDYEKIVNISLEKEYYNTAFFIAQKVNIEDCDLNYRLAKLLLQDDEKYQKDFLLAEYFMQKAGRKGNIEAMTELAERYFYGKDFVQNDSLAFYWSYRAAQQGSKKAAFIVGTLFCDGRGVNKEPEYGRYWLEKSDGLASTICW